jgi:hypothetical protein
MAAAVFYNHSRGTSIAINLQNLRIKLAGTLFFVETPARMDLLAPQRSSPGWIPRRGMMLRT